MLKFPRLTATITALAAVTLLAGCSSIREEHEHFSNRDQKIENVVGNVWRISAAWPGTKAPTKLVEHLQKEAQQFCGQRKMGMLPLYGSSEEGLGDAVKPATAWLEFRCQSGVHVESTYDGINIHYDLDELDNAL